MLDLAFMWRKMVIYRFPNKNKTYEDKALRVIPGRPLSAVLPLLESNHLPGKTDPIGGGDPLHCPM